ncbi:hypothetical protein E3N88_24603 [Mikania micrantha]|uniref:Uncharacterized protein n=1 Tax=Mikania micrantha TaxID=192012 RepID=A0A5N6N2C1_9ASTR|nr:hypothetical protein E3N88_24603 [Mikania micrantha]
MLATSSTSDIHDMGFAMKKRMMVMVMVDDNDDGKLTSMKEDQELEPNNHHRIPRGSWQSGESTSNDTHA